MRIIKLSEKFYSIYKGKSEIMDKKSRPYCCLELKVEGRTYAIPFRHHIKHQHCFHTVGESGIDYTKAVVVLDSSMISSGSARVDTAEWRLINRNEDSIFIGFNKYLRLYRKAVRLRNIPKYNRIVSMSALQYFEI